jgi:sortase (surface protein transpeptidase)
MSRRSPTPRFLRDQAEADRFIRRRKIQFRLTVAAASCVALLLVVLGVGSYKTSPPSYERLLPPPSSSNIVVPRFVQTGAAVNLSDASPPADLPAPTRVLIPAIGVNSSVVPLGRNPNGTAQVPSNVWTTGWYEPGPKPGQVGPAVILGHVDSKSGPGVFYRLRSLLPGDIVTVQSGSKTLRFEVSRLLTYAKNQFPTEAVFGPTPDAELRLITCTGAFDYSTGHYLDNLVVFAIETT